MAHVYHWKHGWIPLDHTAALKKAKGNHHAAKKYLEAARSKDAGINSKEHVVRAAKSVRSVDPKDRGGAVRQVQSAAAKHGVDLPGSKKPVTPAKKAAAPAPAKTAAKKDTAPAKTTSRYQVSRGPDGGAEITASNAASGGHSKIGRVIALPNGKYGAFHLAMHTPTTKHNTEEEAIKAVTDSHSSWKDPAKKRPVPKRTKSGHETTTPADYTVSPGSGGSRIVNGPYGDVVGRVDRTGDGKHTATDHEGHKTVHNSRDAAENYVIFQHDASLPRKGDVPVRDQKTRAPQALGPGMTVGFDRDGNVKQVPLSKREREAAAQAPAVDSMANYQETASAIGADLPSGPTASTPSQVSAYQRSANDVIEQYHRTLLNPSSTPAQKAAAKSIAKNKIKGLRKRYSIDEQSSSWISK